MAEDDDDDGGGGSRFVNYRPNLSLGNILIILTLLGGLASTLVFVSVKAQSIIDDNQALRAELTHEQQMREIAEKAETEARIASEHAIMAQITNIATAEGRDVQAINQTLRDMRDDYRELVRVSQPQGHR